MTTSIERSQEHDYISFDGGVKKHGRRLEIRSATDLISDPDLLKDSPFVTRGAGLSMAPLSFGEGVTTVEAGLLRVIESLDKQEGTVTVGAGAAVGSLLEFLLRHGFYALVLPGYPEISIGGCLASNVHGKNQARDGLFGDHIVSFDLFHPDHGRITASKSENREVFDLTCGGYGLTGTVISVTMKVSRLPAPSLQLVSEEIANIYHLPAVLERKFQSSDSLLSWHDFMLSGDGFGRGIVQWGKFSPQSGSKNQSNPSTSSVVLPIEQTELRTNESILPLDPGNRGFSLPQGFGTATTGAMNSLYYYMSTLYGSSPQTVPVGKCFFPSKTLRDFYYHFFGKHGYHEHQILLSADNFGPYLEKIRFWLTRNDLPITIASSKLFKGEQKLLHFGGDGVCFALNFPRCDAAEKFMSVLDELTVEFGGIPNLCKDSRVPLWVVESTYPQFEEFRRRLREFDPKRRCRSELSERLCI